MLPCFVRSAVVAGCPCTPSTFQRPASFVPSLPTFPPPSLYGRVLVCWYFYLTFQTHFVCVCTGMWPLFPPFFLSLFLFFFFSPFLILALVFYPPALIVVTHSDQPCGHTAGFLSRSRLFSRLPPHCGACLAFSSREDFR